jgi:REP element-mobilizing transposase RayT
MKERKRNRKAGFDYSSQGIYFLTICCKDRINHFGKIYNRKMELNEFGNILNGQIEWMEQQYPYFIIHNYIIMPNHLHILAEISRNRRESSHPIEMNGARIDGDAIGAAIDGDAIGTAIDGDAIGADAIGTPVRTGRDLSLPFIPEKDFEFEKSIQSPQKIKSISELMGALKTTSSKKIHLAGNLHFQWQRSFHDNIVKSKNAYWTIYNYITQNPEKWDADLLFNHK